MKTDCKGRDDLDDCRTCARKASGPIEGPTENYPLVRVWRDGKGRIISRQCLSYRKPLP